MARKAPLHERLRALGCLGIVLASGITGLAHARTIVTCEDPAGERFFSERCPTGTRQVDSRRVATGAPAAVAAPGDTPAKPPEGVREIREIVVYVAPDCVPCDFLERHLEGRRVAFRRVDVEADPTSFEPVKGRLDTVGVPVLTVGNDLLTGFQPKRIDQTLVTQGVLLATDVPNYEPPEAAPPLPPAPKVEPGATLREPDASTAPSRRGGDQAAAAHRWQARRVRD